MNYRLKSKTKGALFYFLKLRPKMLIGVVLLSIIFSFLEAFSVGIFYPLLTEMAAIKQNPEQSKGVISFLFRTAGSIPLIPSIFSNLAIFTTVIVLKNVVGYAREVSSVFLGLSIREHCQTTLFHRLLMAKYSYFFKRKHGDLEYRIVNAPNQLNNLVSIIPDIFTEVLKSFLIIGLLFTVAAKATILIIFIGGVFILAIRYLSSKVSYITGKERVVAGSDITVYCSQALEGIKAVKIFRAENFWKGLFNNAVKRYFNYARKDTIFLYMPSRLLEIAAFSILSLIIGVLVFRYGIESMRDMIPMFGVFVLALQRLLPSFFSIGKNSMQFVSLLPYGETSYEAMKESLQDVDKSGNLSYAFENEIVFKKVSLEYEDLKETALNEINCKIKKNRFVGIVGESGSGKTSMINLLLKVLEPTDGKILVDGVPLCEINTQNWYSKIGYVGQEIFMFHGTIRENVLFGLRDVNDDEVFEVLEMANAIDFIERTDQRLDTIIGDRGLKLSGGQRQRLAIARALLRKPEILILDEATSAVDNISEKLIKDTLRNLQERITIINVAHRLSTIMDADEIIVLENGGIVEMGSFSKLSRYSKCFKRLYRHQKAAILV